MCFREREEEQLLAEGGDPIRDRNRTPGTGSEEHSSSIVSTNQPALLHAERGAGTVEPERDVASRCENARTGPATSCVT